MTIKIAINGYGRIGRNILRALYEGGQAASDIEIVAINDLGDVKTNAHLTRYDSVHGRFPGKVEATAEAMLVNGDRIRVWPSAIRPSCRGPSSGSMWYTSAPASSPPRPRPRPISRPAPRRSSSRPPRPRSMRPWSTASTIRPSRHPTRSSRTPRARPTAWRRWSSRCTSIIGILRGVMTTIHAYTNDQVLIDVYH